MEELLEEAREKDPDALSTLCERYYPRVLRYMRYRVDAATAEDLAGEVFVRVIGAIGNQHGSFRAWLYRIASNVVTDHYRYRKVRETEPMVTQIENPNAQQPHRVVARKEDLRMAMGHLTDAQRELLVLKFIEGLSNEEVAEAMDRGRGAVRALQYRALTALREVLESRGYENE